MKFRKTWLLLVFVCLGAGCESKDVNRTAEKASQLSQYKAPDHQPIPAEAKVLEKTPPPAPIIEPDLNDERFHKDLLDASSDYLGFGLVAYEGDTVPGPEVAPEACAPGSSPLEPNPVASQSDDESSHGKKLYFLFASDIAHYMNQNGSPAPVGQTIVKEAWASQPGSPNARNSRNHSSGHRINPRATVGDKTLEITKRSQLFVMKKLAPETEGTDQGWIYGVIDSDSKNVIASGKVASCVACHEDTVNDRQFGPKLAAANGQTNSSSTDE